MSVTLFNVTPQSGVDLVNTVLATDIAAGIRTVPGRLGDQVWGSDGKRYVLGQAGAALTASEAVTVNTSTFQATAGSGYTSPAVAMATGDYGWFAAPSV